MTWLIDGLRERGTAVDIGAGTGLSSVALSAVLGESWQIIAIEPNREMRSSGTLADVARWQDGTAERTGIVAGSVDLIICAQAFHWFDGPAALVEFRRVLRDETGRVALLWNTHDTKAPSMRAYRDIMLRHATEPPASPSCSGWKSADISSLEQCVDFGDIGVRVFKNEQRLTREGLIDRASSSSYIPNDGAAFESLRKDLSAHFDRFSKDGRIRLLYDTTVYRAEVKPR